jgi:2,4-dienoyl-CoA reductase-like NADH-dependent reductase (Old Yellow Enzyme family)
MMSAIADLVNRRAFFLGVNTGFVSGNIPDARFLAFYAQRSSPDIHCAIVGNVVVPGGYGSNAVTPSLTNDAVWRDVAAMIGARGSLPGIQLATAWEGYVGVRKFVGAAPARVIAGGRELVAALMPEQITNILNAFDDGASLAVEAGFKHIQVHAAHGYLLSLLVDARINPEALRTLDRLAELGERLRHAQVESSIRISMRTGATAFDTNGSAEFHDAISALPFDYVDLSSGYYNIDKRLIYPARPEVLADRHADSVVIARRHPKRQFILSGQALRHDWSALPANIHLGLCRDLIANPNVLRDTTNGCQNNGKCHYYSRGESHLTCARWMPGTSHLGIE